jgi:hypothetical protein
LSESEPTLGGLDAVVTVSEYALKNTSEDTTRVDLRCLTAYPDNPVEKRQQTVVRALCVVVRPSQGGYGSGVPCIVEIRGEYRNGVGKDRIRPVDNLLDIVSRERPSQDLDGRSRYCQLIPSGFGYEEDVAQSPHVGPNEDSILREEEDEREYVASVAGQPTCRQVASCVRRSVLRNERLDYR